MHATTMPVWPEKACHNKQGSARSKAMGQQGGRSCQEQAANQQKIDWPYALEGTTWPERRKGPPHAAASTSDYPTVPGCH